MSDESEIAERVQALLGRADPDLCAYICKGGEVDPALLQNAIREAQDMALMFGCA